METIGLILILAGTLILLILAIDVFLTVIHIGGGGIISKPFTHFIWWIFSLFSGHNPTSPLLRYAGGVILVMLFFFWLFIIWLGFSLVFLGDPDSVIDTITEVSSNEVGKIYFVGYTLTSLGNGDLKAATDAWKIVTNIMGMGSMFFVGLAISYLLPVLQAAVSERTLSTYIYQLGNTPEEIILNGWNGKNFNSLHQRFSTLETMILKSSELLLAYPILQYFHAVKREYSTPLNIAKLDEALTIWEIYEIEPNDDSFYWQGLRKAMDNYLLKLERGYIVPSNDPPPFEYEKIREYWDQSDFSDKTINEKLEDLKERRCLLFGFIKKDLWQWEDIKKA
ncbi:two pore domain potassium channel family protein [Pararhodonellum marinum]|uniref:two pore domain potassium channel family protein n=1 Tax=Pararhodonellum marinum TaxID=2755358 RepID=UPI00188E71C6|nr:two pore domain potassium channel family protein [Pararhodonellum marinum]